MQLEQNRKAHTCHAVLSGVFSMDQDLPVQGAQQIHTVPLPYVPSPQSSLVPLW